MAISVNPGPDGIWIDGTPVSKAQVRALLADIISDANATFGTINSAWAAADAELGSDVSNGFLSSGILRLENVGGTGDSITADLPDNIAASSFTADKWFAFVATAGNTVVGPTITVGGQVRTIRGVKGVPVPADFIKAGRAYVFRSVGFQYADLVVDPISQAELRAGIGTTLRYVGDAVGTASAIELPLPSSFDGIPVSNGNSFSFTASQTSTGPATVAVGERDAVPLLRADGSELKAGSIVAGRTYSVLLRINGAFLYDDATEIELEAQELLTTRGLRQSILYIDFVDGTENELIGVIPSAISWYVAPGGGNLIAFRARYENTGASTLAFGATTRPILRPSGDDLRPGDLMPGQVYLALVTGGAVTLISGSGGSGGPLDTTPEDSDAGFVVEDENGGVLFEAGEETWITDRETSLQKDLAKLDWGAGVYPEALPSGLDLEAMYDLTPASQKAFNTGVMLRGGNGAPMPPGMLPINTEIGKNWVPNATVQLLRDHPKINADPFWLSNLSPEDSFVHPAVAYFPHRFMGFEYLMVVNPYPDANDQLENPVLYGSHDMQNWTLFTHIQQPLAWAEDYDPSFVNTYLSDPWITYNPHSRELIVGWRRHFRNGTAPDGSTHLIEAVTTLDGINWSPRRIIDRENQTAGGHILLAPSYVYNPDQRLWYCYYNANPDWMVVTKRDLLDENENWSVPVPLGFTGWHGEARIVGNRVWLWNNIGHQRWDTSMYWSEANDWTLFTRIDVAPGIVDASDWAAQWPDGVAKSYKNVFIPHLYEDGTISLKLLYQAKRTENEWWLHHLETPRLPYTDGV